MGINLDEIKVPSSEDNMAVYQYKTDYIVVKAPSWSMEKFKGSVDKLGTQMKSVGEVMAIGSTFKEAFNKAFLSLENNRAFYSQNTLLSLEEIYSFLRCPSSERKLF